MEVEVPGVEDIVDHHPLLDATDFAECALIPEPQKLYLSDIDFQRYFLWLDSGVQFSEIGMGMEIYVPSKRIFKNGLTYVLDLSDPLFPYGWVLDDEGLEIGVIYHQERWEYVSGEIYSGPSSRIDGPVRLDYFQADVEGVDVSILQHSHRSCWGSYQMITYQRQREGVENVSNNQY